MGGFGFIFSRRLLGSFSGSPVLGAEGLPESISFNEAKTVQAGFQVAFPIAQAKGYLKVKLK